MSRFIGRPGCCCVIGLLDMILFAPNLATVKRLTPNASGYLASIIILMITTTYYYHIMGPPTRRLHYVLHSVRLSVSSGLVSENKRVLEYSNFVYMFRTSSLTCGAMLILKVKKLETPYEAWTQKATINY